ncbi:MAG: molybdate ABC transporter substrate-binding protein [Alphaproteobacteria bacterium]
MSFARIGRMVSIATTVLFILTLAVTLLAARSARAGDVLAFAAASTTEALTEAAEHFASAGQGRVRGVFAGSSILAKQIENGAPADIYLSANPAWMDYLARRGHIDIATRRDLLANSLVVIAPANSPSGGALDAPADIVAALGDGRLAVGDPDHVPAGIYARQALEALGLWPALQDRLVRTTDVRVALHLVARGEAPLGIVYASDAGAFEGVRVAGSIASAHHAPIRYPIALVAGRDNPTARRFLEFLATPEMAALFRRHGFELP